MGTESGLAVTWVRPSWPILPARGALKFLLLFPCALTLSNVAINYSAWQTFHRGSSDHTNWKCKS